MFSIKFKVNRSTIINKDSDHVLSVITNFNTWIHWSPWLCQEKDCPIERGGQPGQLNHWQSWDCKRMGSGKMTLVEQKGKEYLEYKMEMIKPWKSTSKVTFELQEVDEGVKVTWTMFGSLPLFIFFFKKMMEAIIGNDYMRGLSMLKEWIETGAVESHTDLNEVVTKPGHYYLGLRKDSTIADMPSVMSKDFEALMNLIQAGKVPEPDEYLAYYHNYDMVKGNCSFTSALVYKKKPEHSENLLEGFFPEHKSAQVLHTGSYQHLGNAWSTVMNYQRYEKLKPNKKIPWYEVYLNNPNEVPSSELKTEINIPIR